MQKTPLLLIALSLLSAPAFAGQTLSTSFIDGKGEKIGTATLQEMGNGTLISVDLNLPEGVHAMHVHEKGACDAVCGRNSYTANCDRSRCTRIQP